MKKENFEEMYSKYSPLLKSMAGFYYGKCNAGTQYDDVKQIVDLAFYSAYESFDYSQNDVSYGLYAKICIRNACISFLRKNNRKAKMAEENKTEDYFSDIDLSKYYSSLSHLERTCIDYRIRGQSYQEISNALKIKTKAVDNALSRAKNKIKKLHAAQIKRGNP